LTCKDISTTFFTLVLRTKIKRFLTTKTFLIYSIKLLLA